MTATATRPAAKRYTLNDFAPFIGKRGSANQGLAPLPNATDLEPIPFLNTLAAGGHQMEPVWGYAKLPDNSRQQWTQFFLLTSDGEGYAVTYGSRAPIVRRFAICKHEKIEGPNANHSRGWHPGWCGKCGLDMSYDSGD